MRYMRYIFALLITLITSQAFAAASISAAFGTFSAANGGKANAGQAGTNTMQIQGGVVDKVGGKPIVIIGPDMKCGGVDDSAAVQRAIDAITTGTVTLPRSGTCVVKNLEINNKNNFTLTSLGAKFLMDPTVTSGKRMLRIGYGNVDVTIKGIEFDGNIANAHGNDARDHTAFDVPVIDTYISSGVPTKGLKILNCNIHDNWYEGIRALDIEGLEVSGNKIVNTDVGIDARGCTTPLIANNEIRGGSSEDVSFWADVNASTFTTDAKVVGNKLFKHTNIEGVRGAHFAGNTYKGTGYAVTAGQRTASSDITFSGEKFYGRVQLLSTYAATNVKFKTCDFTTVGTSGDVLWTNGVNDLEVTGSTFTYPAGMTTNANSAGLVIISGSSLSGLIFKGNNVVFEGTAAQKPSTFISLSGYSNADIDHTTIANNGVSGVSSFYLSNMDSATLKLHGTIVGPVVSSINLNSHTPVLYENNYVAGDYIPTVASATSVTMAYATSAISNLFYISGTTDITSIGILRKGKEISLIFRDILTVHNGNNLLLKGGDFTTSNNATLTLISDGTNWVEKSRSNVTATQLGLGTTATPTFAGVNLTATNVAGSPVFTGSGVDDMSVSGSVTSSLGDYYTIQIQSVNAIYGTMTVQSGGAGYLVGDVVTGTGVNSSISMLVTSVDSGGAVTGFSKQSSTSGYTVSIGNATTNGSGTGFTFNITSVSDTVQWRKNGTGIWNTTFARTSSIVLMDGVTIRFASNIGHTVNDQWVTTVVLSNPLTITGANGYLYASGGVVTTAGGSSIASYTWAGVPSASSNTGTIIRVSDIGTSGTLFISNGTYWRPASGSVVLAQSAVQNGISYAVQGTTQTTLATISIPAGIMGPNGSVKIRASASVSNTAGTKTFGISFGGTLYTRSVPTTSLYTGISSVITNRNSVTSQVGAPNTIASPDANSGAAVVTSSVNTNSAVTVLITGQCSGTGDTITLESYVVEVLVP